MTKSKTQIEKQMQKKNNPELVETLMNAKKKDKWLEVAGIISGPRRKRIDLNLNEINNQTKDKEKVGCEFSSILTEIKLNPSAEGIKILK